MQDEETGLVSEAIGTTLLADYMLTNPAVGLWDGWCASWWVPEV